MPTPITVSRIGTGWTVDVTTLILSTNLGFKDFYVRINGVASPLSNFTKTNPALITYTGTALGSSLPVVVYRDSNKLIDDASFGDVNSSSAFNTKLTQVELVLEDLRQLIGTVV